MTEYSLYIVKCNDDTLYCGITSDPVRRLKEHNEGRRGAKYTRSRRPVFFVLVVQTCCKSCALRLEIKVKALSKKKKLLLIDDPSLIDELKVECRSINS